MSDKVIRYGDYILLMGILTPSDSDAVTRGYLHGLGHSDMSIYFNRVGRIAKYKEVPEWKEILSTKHDALFRVAPKTSSKYHLEFLKLEKQFKREQNPRKKEKMKWFLDQARQKMMEESEKNRVILEKKAGKSLAFGDEIQLYHVRSRSFMTATKDSCKYDRSNYQVGLSQIEKSEMGFVICPQFKINVEGDPIHYQDHFLLYNPKMKGFLGVSSSNSSEGIELRGRKRVLESLSPEITFKRSNLFVPQESAVLINPAPQDFYWEALECKGYSGESDFINENNFIYLKHTQFNAYLTCSVEKDDTSQIFLRRYEGIESLEEKAVEGVWQIQCLSENPSDGMGRLKTNSCQILLRNYFTGMVLMISEKTGKLTCEPLVLKANNDLDCWKLTSLETNEGFITDKEAYMISNESMSLMIGVNSERNRHNFKTKKIKTSIEDIDVDSDRFYQKVLPEIEKIRKYQLDLEEKKQSSLENAFFIERVPQEKMDLVFYLESSFPFLNDFCTLVKYGVIKYLGIDTIYELLGIIMNLSAFVVGVPPEEYDPSSNEYEPIPARQKLCKDMRFIEAITEVLYVFSEGGLVQLEKINEEKEAQRLLRQIYRLLAHILKDNKPNEIHATQWFSFFIHQSLKTHGVNSIGAQDMLVKLLDNNYGILKKLDQKIIEKLVYSLKSQTHDKLYIQLINALVICDGKRIERNQEAVSYFFFEKKFYEEWIRIFPKVNKFNDAGIQIESEFMALNDIQTTRGQEENPFFSYFCCIVSLMSNLCKGRNFRAIMPVRKYFSFRFCVNVIQNRFLDFSIKKLIMNLLFHLYIDTGLSKVMYPHYLRLWKESTGEFVTEPVEVKEKEDLERLQKIKMIATEFLQSQASKGYLRLYALEYNQFLSEVLNLTKKILDFGFLGSPSEMETLQDQMLNILDSSFDVSFPSEEEEVQARLTSSKRRKGRAKTLLLSNKGLEPTKSSEIHEKSKNAKTLSEIKLHAVRILGIIDKIKLDLRISVFLDHFKNFLVLEPETIKRSSLVFSKKRSQVAPLKGKGTVLKRPIDWLIGALSVDQSDMSLRISCALLGSLLFQNEELVIKSFELFKRNFEKLKTMTWALKSLYLVADEEQFQDLFKIGEIASQLTHEAIRSELWIYDERKCEEWVSILDDLHILLRGEKIKFSEVWRISTQNININRNYSLYSSLEDLHFYVKDMAQIFLHKKGEKGLIEVLRYTSRINGTIPEFVVSLQSQTINTLTVLASLIPHFQYDLLKEMNLLVRMIKKHENNNAQVLLREIIKDKMVLKDAEFNNKMIRKLVKAASSLLLVNNFPLASSMLNCIESFMVCKGEIIKTSHISFINCVAKDISIIFTEDVSDQPERIKKLLGNVETQRKQFTDWLNKLKRQSTSLCFEVSPILAYSSNAIRLLTMSCQGRSGSSENIAHRIFSLDDLKQLQKSSLGFPYISIEVWGFLYECYLYAEIRSAGWDNAKISGMFLEILEELKLALSFITEWASDQLKFDHYTIRDHKGAIPLKKFYVSLVADKLCPIINEGSLASFFLDKEKANLFSTQVFEFLEKIIARLPYPFSSPEMVAMNTTMENLATRFPQVKYGEKSPQAGRNALFEDFCVLKPKRRKSKETSFAYIQRIKQKSESIVAMMKSCLEEFENINTKNPTSVQELIAKEYSEMIMFLISVEKKSRLGQKSRVPLAKKDVFKGLLRALELQTTAESADFIVRIFRLIVEETIGLSASKDDSKTIAEENLKSISFNPDPLREIQGDLLDLGLLELLVDLFIKFPKKRTREQVILTLIALLFGNNSSAQDKFNRKVSTSSNNEFCIELFHLGSLIFKEMNSKMKKATAAFRKDYYEHVALELTKESTTSRYKDRRVTVGLLSYQLSKSYKEIRKDRNDIEMVENQSPGSFSPENSKSQKRQKETQEKDPENYEKEELVKFATRIVRLMTLLCAGQFRPNQDLLRDQFFNGLLHGNSKCFLSLSVSAFGQLVYYINDDCVDFGIDLVSFLIEMLDGPVEQNQLRLSSLMIVECTETLLVLLPRSKKLKVILEKRGIYSKEGRSKVHFLVNKCIRMMNMIIQGTDNKTIFEYMEKYVNCDLLLQMMTEEYRHYCKTIKTDPEKLEEVLAASNRKLEFLPKVKEAFNVYMLLSDLEEMSPKLKQQIKETIADSKSITRCAHCFFKKSTGRIEVVLNNGILFPYYFPIDPYCNGFGTRAKKDFLSTIERSTYTEKINVDYFSWLLSSFSIVSCFLRLL